MSFARNALRTVARSDRTLAIAICNGRRTRLMRALAFSDIGTSGACRTVHVL
jgi:hypothetical protein